MKIILVVITLILYKSSCSQICEQYEIKNIPVYFTISENEKSIVKVNDSLSFSIVKLKNQQYRVEKILKGTVLNSKNYKYKGKSRYQFFKMRKRNIDKVIVVREKRKICLLE